MSDTEKQVEKVEEQKNVVTANAAPSEPTKLKNDAEDLGPAVVKPTDNTPDNAKKVKKVSDQVNKDANDGSLPNDQKPSSMKKRRNGRSRRNGKHERYENEENECYEKDGRRF